MPIIDGVAHLDADDHTYKIFTSEAGQLCRDMQPAVDAGKGEGDD